MSTCHHVVRKGARPLNLRSRTGAVSNWVEEGDKICRARPVQGNALSSSRIFVHLERIPLMPKEYAIFLVIVVVVAVFCMGRGKS